MAFQKPFSVANAALDLQERTQHVYPLWENDHLLSSACWCEPELEWITCADGKQGLVVVHHQRQ